MSTYIRILHFKKAISNTNNKNKTFTENLKYEYAK